MFGSEGGLALLQQMVTGVHILLDFAGAAVCLMYLRRSLWAGVTAVGLGLSGLVSVWYQVVTVLIQNGTWTPRQYSLMISLVGTPLGLLARVALVAGIIGLLVRKETARPSPTLNPDADI
jgi:hypothetical protein